jgi:hypothetical protein
MQPRICCKIRRRNIPTVLVFHNGDSREASGVALSKLTLIVRRIVVIVVRLLEFVLTSVKGFGNVKPFVLNITYLLAIVY